MLGNADVRHPWVCGSSETSWLNLKLVGVNDLVGAFLTRSTSGSDYGVGEGFIRVDPWSVMWSVM